MSYRRFHLLTGQDGSSVELRETWVHGQTDIDDTWQWRAYAVESDGLHILKSESWNAGTFAGALVIAAAFFAAREKKSVLRLHQNLDSAIDALEIAQEPEYDLVNQIEED